MNYLLWTVLGLVSAKTYSNGSNIIITGGGGSESGGGGSVSSGGISITLDQCNTQCSSVNTILFDSCGSDKSDFSKQMQCACSSFFLDSVTQCSSCCQQLNYVSQYQELIQVVSACNVIETSGNYSAEASSLVYTTITAVATDYSVTTETQVETYTAQPIYSVVTTVYPEASTVWYKDHGDSSTYSIHTTSVTSVYETPAPTPYETPYETPQETPYYSTTTKTVKASPTPASHETPYVTPSYRPTPTPTPTPAPYYSSSTYAAETPWTSSSSTYREPLPTVSVGVYGTSAAHPITSYSRNHHIMRFIALGIVSSMLVN